MELRRLRVFAFLTGYTVYCLENVYFFTIFLTLHRPAKLYVKSILRKSDYYLSWKVALFWDLTSCQLENRNKKLALFTSRQGIMSQYVSVLRLITSFRCDIFQSYFF